MTTKEKLLKVQGSTVEYAGYHVATLTEDVPASTMNLFLEYLEDDNRNPDAQDAAYDDGFADGSRQGIDEGYGNAVDDIEFRVHRSSDEWKELKELYYDKFNDDQKKLIDTLIDEVESVIPF
jgi:hypothetical protein